MNNERTHRVAGCRYQKLDRARRGIRPGNSHFRWVTYLELQPLSVCQSVPKGRDWIGFATSYCALGVDGHPREGENVLTRLPLRAACRSYRSYKRECQEK